MKFFLLSGIARLHQAFEPPVPTFIYSMYHLNRSLLARLGLEEVCRADFAKTLFANPVQLYFLAVRALANDRKLTGATA